MSCIDLSNKRFLKGEILWRNRFGVSSAPSLVQKAILFLWILQKWIFTISSQTNPFKKLWIQYQKYANIPFFKRKHNIFKNSFFPSTILFIERNNLDLNIRSSSSINIFRNSTFKFIRAFANSVFNSHNPKGLSHNLSHKTETRSKSLAKA